MITNMIGNHDLLLQAPGWETNQSLGDFRLRQNLEKTSRFETECLSVFSMLHAHSSKVAITFIYLKGSKESNSPHHKLEHDKMKIS